VDPRAGRQIALWSSRTGAPDGEEIRVVEYPGTLGELTESLRPGGRLAYRGLAMALLISLSLHRPVLLEREVGVGKTEVAKVLAGIFGRKLIRLQCYEGIDTLGRPSRRCQLAEGSALTGLPS
jgi:MoxR-like ATPase